MDLCPDHNHGPYTPKHGAYPCIRCFDEALARVDALERENATLLAQRNESLSMLGAIIGAQGGEVRIPDAALMIGYAFESHRDPLHHETILRVVAD